MSKILVIEKNPDNLKRATALFQSRGHTTIEAINAGEGLRLAREELPDLILMDTRLPGIDAPTATRLLKMHPLTKGIKLITLMVSGELNDKEKLLNLGANASISQPDNYDELINVVENFLAKEC